MGGSTDIESVAITVDPLHVDRIEDTKISIHLNDNVIEEEEEEEERVPDLEETRQLIPSELVGTTPADSNTNNNRTMRRTESTKDSPSSSMATSPHRHHLLSFRGKQQQQQQQSPAGTSRPGGTKIPAGSTSSTTYDNIIASWIERIESYRISSSSHWSRRFRIEPDTPWIQGLASVWYEGKSCADAIRIVGIQPPRYLWYMISGGICDVIQFIGNALLYYRIHVNVSLAWAIGFITVIPIRHTSHRYLVFGDYVGGYYHSLARMYAGYSVTIVASTILNYGFSRYVANMPLLYAITMIMTGIASYFILKRFWNIGGGGGGATTTSTTTELAPLSDGIV
jgi:putative flippase GtrA